MGTWAPADQTVPAACAEPVGARAGSSGEIEFVATCRKCGARKRRWPRSCPACRAGSGRADVAAEGADVAVAAGALGWIGRGITGLVRLVMRALN